MYPTSFPLPSCRMLRVIHFPRRLLLLFLMVCSYQFYKTSWCYAFHPGELMIRRWKQASSNRSSLLTDIVFEPEFNAGQIAHVAQYQSSTYIESVLTGAMATFDVYNFHLNSPDLSASKISVVNVHPAGFNSVLAGWVVNPSVYGDSKTHFVTEWGVLHSNGPDRGCNDLACDGFVPVNYAPITPGDVLEPNNGQLKITIKIFKSKVDGDWWLHFGYNNDNLRPVGYWPKSLFTSLANHANGVFWGGYTQSHAGSGSPPMGNGEWPIKGSASARDVKYVDSNGVGYKPAPWPAGVISRVSHKQCYQVSPLLDGMFHYGGPGGCTS